MLKDIVDILIFFFFFFFFEGGGGVEVLCFILIVQKDKRKVLNFDMMDLPYFEISAVLF